MKSCQRIVLALRLVVTGRKLERARKRLQSYYLRGEPNDSKRKCRLRNRFNALCNMWTALEKQLEEKSQE